MNTLSRIWRSLEEPPEVTVFAVVVHFAAVVGGLGLWLDPTPVLVAVPQVFETGLGLAFALSGLVGLPSAWTGRWWLERITLSVVLSALTVTVGILLSTTVMGVDVYWMTLFLMVPAYGFYITRWLRMRRTAYKPGTGPLTPYQKAMVLKAVHGPNQ